MISDLKHQTKPTSISVHNVAVKYQIKPTSISVHNVAVKYEINTGKPVCVELYAQLYLRFLKRQNLVRMFVSFNYCLSVPTIDNIHLSNPMLYFAFFDYVRVCSLVSNDF